MKYRSTAGDASGRSFADVVLEGAAPDGGLYVPETVPQYDPPASAVHSDYVACALEAFGATGVEDLITEAFSRFHHPEIAPLVEVGDCQVLELFWGPTLSFKDHAMQVLARLFNRYLTERGEERTVLVATSGDTGSAAIEAFRGLEAVQIVVLYPTGMVSDYQRRQMTTVKSPNVKVLSVAGTFDDCQRMIKEAFRNGSGLASANSINWGRLASQIGYYLATAGRIEGPFEVVVPTGNFGNAYSGWMAKRMGVPISQIVIATNANKVLFDLYETGKVRADKPVATLAPAMDIQVPSNLERYLSDHSPSAFSGDFRAGWADDATILETIARVYETHGVLIDPHTAAAWAVADTLETPTVPRVVVSTAHPAKFAATIERATGISPEVPEWGVIDPSLPERSVEIAPELEALEEYL
ncbi:MAG: threonine synthase [Acidimicrobiia bacterium]